MMGSGKTLVGKKLANEINFSFIDTDNLIEKKAGKSINRIFMEEGELYFRELEEHIVTGVLNKKNHVISLGGGAIVNNAIRKIIKNNSYNIYLKVKIDILASRLYNSKKRPLIKSKNIEKTLTKLITKREYFYNQADLIIKNENTTKHLIENIIKKLN